jgi:hypothetical protein
MIKQFKYFRRVLSEDVSDDAAIKYNLQEAHEG